MIHALLVLAAAPLLEPDPGALARLQPRDVTARGDDVSALWSVDDDATTAWKPKLEVASFTWHGQPVVGARRLKVYVRAGCQESERAFAGHARPRHITFTAAPYFRMKVVIPLDDPPEEALKPIVAELADVSGWQAIDVPYMWRFELAVKDVYAGKEQADTVCISDVRVYVEAPQVDAGEEQVAFERIKRAIAERVTRAADRPKRVPARFVEVPSPAELPKAELALRAADDDATLQKKARVTVSALRAVAKTSLAQLEAGGWKRVSLDFVMKDDASLEESLRGRRAIGAGDALLATADFKLSPAVNPIASFKETVKGLQKLAGHPLECQAACMPLYAATSASALEAREDCERLCRDPKSTADARLDIAGSAVLVKGPLDAPTQLLIVSSRERGEREVYRSSQRQLLVYEAGHVTSSAIIEYDARWVDATLLTWNEEGSAVRAMAQLSFQGQKVDDVQRLEAKTEHAMLEVEGETMFTRR